MIRDIRTSKPEHLKVSCHRGGKVTDINQELSQYEAKYDKVAIVIGTNDSDDEKATTTAISENFKNLICEAKFFQVYSPDLSLDLELATSKHFRLIRN